MLINRYYIVFFLFSFCSVFAQKDKSLLSKKMQKEPLYRIQVADRDTTWYLMREARWIDIDKKVSVKQGKHEDIYRVQVYGACLDSMPFNIKDFPNLVELQLAGNPFFLKNLSYLKNLQVFSFGTTPRETCQSQNKLGSYYLFPTDELFKLKQLRGLTVIPGYAIWYVPERIFDHPSLHKISFGSSMPGMFGNDINVIPHIPLSILFSDKEVAIPSGLDYPGIANLLHAGYDCKVNQYHFYRTTLPNEVWYPGKEGVAQPPKPKISKNGHFVNYYLNGNKIAEGDFVKGKPDREWTLWYVNKQVCEKRFYKNGIEEGVWCFFKENGDTTKVLNFEKGALTNVIYYRHSVSVKEDSTTLHDYSKVNMNFLTGIFLHEMTSYNYSSNNQLIYKSNRKNYTQYYKPIKLEDNIRLAAEQGKVMFNSNFIIWQEGCVSYYDSVGKKTKEIIGEFIYSDSIVSSNSNIILKDMLQNFSPKNVSYKRKTYEGDVIIKEEIVDEKARAKKATMYKNGRPYKTIYYNEKGEVIKEDLIN